MQSKKNSLISIIIPTYNRAELIKDTLLSVEVQTYTNWECIIVDDGSTDNSKEIVEEFTKRDHRFKLVTNIRKKGAQGARNTGLLNAKGEYISFFDSDDIMHPSRLSKQIQYLENNSDCDICTCYSHLLNDENEIIGAFVWITNGKILMEILEGSTYVDYNSSVIRKSTIDKIGMLDEECPSYQEWDTNIRLSEIANYGTVNELLISYYQRSSGRISNNTKRELHGLSYIYAKHQKLWIEKVGEAKYFSRVYSLAGRISKEDKIFQKEMILVLPELKKAILKFEVITFLRRMLTLLR